jgi:hypothetical protein
MTESVVRVIVPMENHRGAVHVLHHRRCSDSGIDRGALRVMTEAMLGQVLADTSIHPEKLYMGINGRYVANKWLNILHC